MNVTVFRIDDRLIHGQIVTAWLAHADATRIVVADDAASKDMLQQSLLKMATPKNVELKILNLNDAKEYLSSDDSDTKTLLLTRGSNQAMELIEESGVSTINVGNINMKKGKTKVLDNLWVDEEDVRGLKNLSQKVEVEVRAVPSDKKQIVIDLLNKLGL